MKSNLLNGKESDERLKGILVTLSKKLNSDAYATTKIFLDNQIFLQLKVREI